MTSPGQSTTANSTDVLEAIISGGDGIDHGNIIDSGSGADINNRSVQDNIDITENNSSHHATGFHDINYQTSNMAVSSGGLDEYETSKNEIDILPTFSAVEQIDVDMNIDETSDSDSINVEI